MHEPRWTGIDPRVRSEIEGALASLTRDWPGVEPKAIHFDQSFGQGYAATDRRDGQVHFNHGFARDYEAWQQSVKADTEDTFKGLRENGLWDPRVASHYRSWEHPARYGMTHEFGHLVDMALWGFGVGEGGDGRVDAYTEIIGLAARAADPKFRGESDRALAGFAWFTGMLRGPIAKDLSLYGTTSPPELIAEGFAVGTLYPGTSKSADAILGYLKDTFAHTTLQHPQIAA